MRENVLRRLPSPSSRAYRSRAQIRADLTDFLLDGADPQRAGPGSVELWAWVGAYDHVVICQLWGDMTALPRFMPRYTRELKQYWEFAGRPALPGAPDDAHDALADARYNLERYRVIAARSGGAGRAR